MRLICILFWLAYAAEYAKWHFFRDLGEVIPDRSGNGFDAVNGSDHTDTDTNMLQKVDRGIYQNGNTQNFVQGSQNTYSTSQMTLLEDFSIGCMIQTVAGAGGKLCYASYSDSTSPSAGLLLGVWVKNSEIIMNRLWGGQHEENKSSTGLHNQGEWNYHVTSVWKDGSDYEMTYYINGSEEMSASNFGTMPEVGTATMYFGYQHGRSGHEHLYFGFIHSWVILKPHHLDMESQYWVTSARLGWSTTPWYYQIATDEVVEYPATCGVINLDNDWMESWSGACGDSCQANQDDWEPCTGCDYDSCHYNTLDGTTTCNVMNWHSSCQTCSANHANNACTSCTDANATALGGDGSCYCNMGFIGAPYADDDCEACHADCKTCSEANDDTKCNQWQSNATLDGIAPTTCSWSAGYYKENSICVDCHLNCAECNGSEVTNCTSCADTDANIVADDCICNEGFYDKEASENVECDQWFSTCKSWDGGTSADCIECNDDNATPDAGPSGSWECVDGFVNTAVQLYYVTCTQCDQSWQTWSGLGNTNWDSWAPGYYMQPPIGTSKTWLDNWPSQYMMDTASLTCTPWPAQTYNSGTPDSCSSWFATCETCEGSGINEWLTCRDANASIPAGAPGACECNANYVDQDALQTMDCQGVCATEWLSCNGVGFSNDDCLMWADGYCGLGGTGTSCRDSCPDGWMCQNKLCLQCYPQNADPTVCQTCTDQTMLGCTDCVSDNAELTGGTDVWDWITGFYNADSGSGMDCQQCHDNCATCEGTDYTQCKSCVDGNAQVAGGGTSGACEWMGGFWNTGTGNDVNCETLVWHVTCGTCSDPTINGCESCSDANAHLPSGAPDACVCKAGYFDSDGDETMRCDTDGTCAQEWGLWFGDRTNDDCWYCSSGYWKDGSSCRVDWPVGKYCGIFGCSNCSTIWGTWTGGFSFQWTSWYPNATDNGSGCECDDGFYWYGGWWSATGCAEWNEAWETCDGGDANDCNQCADGYYLQPGTSQTCQDACPDGYYLRDSDRTCQGCHANCATWTSSSDPDNWVVCADSHATVSTVSNECECNTDYYNVATPPDVSCSDACPAGCHTCPNPAPDRCTLCLTGFYKQPGTPYTCLSTWPIQYFQDNLECTACAPACEYCNDYQDASCTSCLDRNAEINGALQGEWVWQDGFVDDEPTNDVDCIPCTDNCYTWAGSTSNWLTWDGNYYLQPLSPQWLLDSCPSGYVKIQQNYNNICQQCTSPCDTCDGPSATDCITCLDTDALASAGGECQCTIGFYDADTSADVDCEPCYLTCRTWQDNSADKCMSCIDANATIDATPGPCTCPRSFVDIDQNDDLDCQPCTDNWNECGNFSQSYCISWTANYHLQPAGPTANTCELTCPDGYYQGTNICESCVYPCATCNGGTSSDWITCSPADSAVVAAQCQWNPGFYDIDASTNFNCKACYATCESCYDDFDDACLSWWDNNAQLGGGSGGEWIWNETFVDVDSTGPGQNCLPCNSNCYTCGNFSQSHCLTCTGLYYLQPLNAACELTCPDGYYKGTNICEAWVYPCATCSGGTSSDWITCSPADSAVVASQCQWNPGFYDIDASAIFSCKACYATCESCYDDFFDACMSWFDINAQLGGGSGGEWICNESFVDVDSTGPGQNCLPCNSNCHTCGSYSQSHCLTCTGLYYLQPSTAACQQTCPDTYYKGANIWEQCNSPCSNCIGPSQTNCLTCVDGNATANAAGECLCNSGTYDIDTTANLDCQSCVDEWAECSGLTNDDWISCADGFFAISGYPGQCRSAWPDKYFLLDLTASWEPCYMDWAQCVDGSLYSCTSWVDAEATPVPSNIGEWECISGYAQSTNPLVCGVCHVLCKTCSGPNQDECKTCHENANIQSAQCIWNNGYYREVNDGPCAPWDDTWATCTGPADNECTSCHDYGFVNASGQWEWCSTGSYYDTDENTCSPCFSEWVTWVDYPACITCVDTLKEPSEVGVCEYIPCAEGQYQNSGTCLSCHATCVSCSQEFVCQKCVENASFDGSSDCQWDFSYIETGTGWDKDTQPPTPIPQVASASSVQFNFDEKIASSLTVDDILNVNITGPRSDGYEYTWSIVEDVERQTYSLMLNFEHEDIPENTNIEIVLNPNISDEHGNKLSTNIIGAEIPSQEEDPPSDEELAKEMEGSLEDTNKVAMAASVASGAVTGDFGSAWNMLNTLQILAFVPMMPNKIPLPLVAVLKSFLEFEVIPNLFEYMQDEDEFVGEKPYQEAQDFMYEESVFLSNGGEMLSQMLAMFMFLPIALLLHKVKNHRIAGYFDDVVRSYRWGFFLRGWTEVYLEVLTASMLQCLQPSYANATLTINTILGYLYLFFLSITPASVTIFLIRSHEKIKDPTSSFKKFYGSFFSEFKNDRGWKSGMYYSWFFWRRWIYIVNIIYMRNHIYLQLVINIAHWLISLVYQVIYMPYVSNLTNYTSVYSESGTMIVFAACFSFEMDWSGDTREIMSWATISLIFSIMLFNYVDIFYHQYCAFRTICQRWRNRRKMELMQGTDKNKIAPEKKIPRVETANNTMNETLPDVAAPLGVIGALTGTRLDYKHQMEKNKMTPNRVRSLNRSFSPNTTLPDTQSVQNDQTSQNRPSGIRIREKRGIGAMPDYVKGVFRANKRPR